MPLSKSHPLVPDALFPKSKVLDTQYRMHPAIREFPSATFYGGGLKDGADVAAQTKRAWHASPAFAPLVFYDVPGREGTPAGSNSLVNTTEAEVVLSIYRELIHRHPELRGRPAVAVISPYKAQVSLLRRLFLAALGPDMAKTVDINTIDGFQVLGGAGSYGCAVMETRSGGERSWSRGSKVFRGSLVLLCPPDRGKDAKDPCTHKPGPKESHAHPPPLLPNTRSRAEKRTWPSSPRSGAPGAGPSASWRTSGA